MGTLGDGDVVLLATIDNRISTVDYINNRLLSLGTVLVLLLMSC